MPRREETTKGRTIPTGLAVGVILAAASAPMQLWGLVAIGVVVAIFSLYRNAGGGGDDA